MKIAFMLLLGGIALFLILLVLVQRGRGGGLAGALGGAGGSSAFGAKAGDIFTKMTFIAAAIWIVLCIGATKLLSTGESSLLDVGDGAGAASMSATKEEEGDSEAAAESSTDEEATAEEEAEGDSE